MKQRQVIILFAFMRIFLTPEQANFSMHLTPTLCRPRHVDLERLRSRFGEEKFAKLRYHEAAVVSTATMKFQLLALTSDMLFIVPLTGRSEVSADMSLPLRVISTVARVVPKTKKQRELLLLSSSQLFRLQMRECKPKQAFSELFFATFEPQTQLFFHLSRALRADLQRQLLPQCPAVESTREQRFELAGLLEALAIDFIRARDDTQRIHLLDELSAAGQSCDELKHLFFENRTQLQGCSGLATFLINQLGCRLYSCVDAEVRLELELGVARVLSVMCFDVQLWSSAVDMLALDKLVVHIIARGVESYAIHEKSSGESTYVHARVLREDFLDAQASLLLALDAIQKHEDFRLYQQQRSQGLLREQSTPVAQLMLRAPALSQWLPKFFKRVCIALSRVAIAIEQEETCDDIGDAVNEMNVPDDVDAEQTLALWRSVTLLELLVESDTATGGNQVLALLLQTRKDYIDMHLRVPRFRDALRTSGIPQLQDVAEMLNRFLEALRDRRKG